jgi:hypothetical protein
MVDGAHDDGRWRRRIMMSQATAFEMRISALWDQSFTLVRCRVLGLVLMGLRGLRGFDLGVWIWSSAKIKGSMIKKKINRFENTNPFQINESFSWNPIGRTYKQTPPETQATTTSEPHTQNTTSTYQSRFQPFVETLYSYTII